MAVFKSTVYKSTVFNTGSIVNDGGYRSRFGWWVGGLCAPSLVPPPTPTESHGGFDEHYYRKYREYLEDLTKATSVKDKRAAAKELIELPIETTEIQKFIEKPELKGTLRLARIDHEKLNREIQLIYAYLDMLQMHRLNMLREQDDEAAFLMMMA